MQTNTGGTIVDFKGKLYLDMAAAGSLMAIQGTFNSVLGKVIAF